MDSYIKNTIDLIYDTYRTQPEFVQAVEEFLLSIEPVIRNHPEYEKNDLFFTCAFSCGDRDAVCL